ncbi:hypothetical protein DOS70_05035 [Staphylococcus felis]|uniref:Uncharacterized protein n=1 Tax=Staphylococcus felis TaxID=46127 RepID=A0A2K3ZIX8_9STAP|nr:hypothetical protein [Staphylococcus felis]AVP36143.1 hypothetical protein C7J90_03960 [Staphylococcus felis]MBH9580522.1 hypothetical protein [Staphylococcus felis]MDM8328378.1 hypothetical protein [Staphylococcus felis]MDQ7192755.1 hypothetical protein [Staphylococcus felis]PNZ37836.1 hypothetical protein CD143_01285 [Staphylococcus felis]
MKFNGWIITIKYNGEHEVVTNENTLLVIDEEYDVALVLKETNGFIKVSHVNYGSDFYVNADTKELILEIRNPYNAKLPDMN